MTEYKIVESLNQARLLAEAVNRHIADGWRTDGQLVLAAVSDTHTGLIVPLYAQAMTRTAHEYTCRDCGQPANDGELRCKTCYDKLMAEFRARTGLKPTALPVERPNTYLEAVAKFRQDAQRWNEWSQNDAFKQRVLQDLTDQSDTHDPEATTHPEP